MRFAWRVLTVALANLGAWNLVVGGDADRDTEERLIAPETLGLGILCSIEEVSHFVAVHLAFASRWSVYSRFHLASSFAFSFALRFATAFAQRVTCFLKLSLRKCSFSEVGQSSIGQRHTLVGV
jgi:hypothetical protein